MLTPDEEAKQIEEMTKIFSDAFAEAAERNGIPAKEVAEQFAVEMGKRAEDDRRLKDACIASDINGWGSMPEQYDPAKDADHPMNQ